MPAKKSGPSSNNIDEPADSTALTNVSHTPPGADALHHRRRHIVGRRLGRDWRIPVRRSTVSLFLGVDRRRLAAMIGSTLLNVLSIVDSPGLIP
jgi:hypothetical protein